MRNKISYIILISIILLSLTSVTCVKYTPRFAPQSTICDIRSHVISIATYFFIDYEHLQRLQKADKYMPYKLMQVFPLKVSKGRGGKPEWLVAFIGSGTIVGDNHIITVNHLFVDEYYGTAQAIYVFKEGWDHPIEADIVAISEGNEFYDDYAVIKPREDLGVKGLKIAKPDDLKLGDKVIYSGTPGGMRVTRYGHLTYTRWFFRRDQYDNRLHFSPFQDFDYLCVLCGGPGDSGGSMITIDGKLYSILYCGVHVYGTEYIFANPNFMLTDFLKKHKLEWIGE